MTTKITLKLSAGFPCEGRKLLRAHSNLLWIRWECLGASYDVVSLVSIYLLLRYLYLRKYFNFFM